MGRVEENRKILEVWRDAGTKSKSFDEMTARLLAQQNAILADISRSMAVIADNSYSDFDKYFCKKGDAWSGVTFKNVEERSGGSDDGEEKGL